MEMTYEEALRDTLEMAQAHLGNARWSSKRLEEPEVIREMELARYYLTKALNSLGRE